MSFDSQEISRYSGKPAECYRFVHGITVWRLTSADRPIAIADGTYYPEAVSSNSEDRSQEWDSGGLKLTLDAEHAVSLLYQQGPPREPVLVTVFSVQRGESTTPIRFQGEIARAENLDRSTVFQCVPVSYRVKRRLPLYRYSALCSLPLYGSRCGVDKSSFRLRVTVSAVSGDVVFAGALSSQASGWWLNGYVQTIAGETRFIVQHSGSAITLEYSLGVAVGDVLDVFAGCDRTEATCISKFSNGNRHMGFPHIPVRDLFGPSVE